MRKITSAKERSHSLIDNGSNRIPIFLEEDGLKAILPRGFEWMETVKGNKDFLLRSNGAQKGWSDIWGK
ncbi:hypothetical protein SLA2020_087670 [Shorea laevis]